MSVDVAEAAADGRVVFWSRTISQGTTPPWEPYRELRGLDPASSDALDPQLDSIQGKPANGLAQGVERQARIDQRSQQHVAGGARETV
jgi:hypothetical protein